MADYVVDTNVWAMVDKPIGEVSLTEVYCIACCKKWLMNFNSQSDDRLILDIGQEILKEYRRNAKEGGIARQLLNVLQAQPRNRLVELEIEFDDDGFAIVPAEISEFDRSDRKFVAVALAHNPHPPIVNATDTDWTKARDQIEAVGISVSECCADYVAERLKGKKQE